MRSSRGRLVAKVLGVVALLAASMAVWPQPAAANNGVANGWAFIQPEGVYGTPQRIRGFVSDNSTSCNVFQDCDRPTGVVDFHLRRGDGFQTTFGTPVVPDTSTRHMSLFEFVFSQSLPASSYELMWDFRGDFNLITPDFFLSFTVSPRPCETVLSQSIASSLPGGTVQLRAKVSTAVPSHGPATGTVTFYQDDGTPAPDIVLDSVAVDPGTNTAYSRNVGPVLPAGATTPIYAVYSGDNNHVGNCQSNVVHHTVSANPQPTAQDDSAFTMRDTPVEIDVLANDAHPSGAALFVEVLDGPSHGDLDASVSPLLYTPDDGYVGDDVFRYFVTDPQGNQSSPATVAIEVGCDPVAAPDDYTTPFATALVVGTFEDGVMANDDTCERAAQVVVEPAHGTLSGFDPSNGLFTYTPEPGFVGLDFFVYAYSFAGEQVLGTVAIRVLPDPDAPLPSLVSIGDAELTRPETGTAPMTFTVTRFDPEGAAGEAVTVQYATREDTAIAGVDFTASSGTVTIPAGATSATFTVPIIGNRAGDPDKAFFVDLSAPVGALIDDGTAVGTIRANGVLAGCSTTDTATGRYVCQVYQDVLGRVPEPGGKAYWAERIDRGDPREQLTRLFVLQPESRRTAVRRLYQLYLGRPGDPAGVESWSARLAAGATLDAVRAELLASDELYQSGGGTDEAWVEAVYQAVLRRGAEPTGAAFWLDQLRSRSRLSVAKAMLATAEGRGRVVIETYQRFLDRSPSATELAEGRAVLATHGELHLQALLLASEEYRVNSTA